MKLLRRKPIFEQVIQPAPQPLRRPLERSRSIAERGQGLLELALILPLLLVLLLAIIDVGRLFFIYSEISSAVREAIRFSAVNPYDCVGIRDRARSTLSLTDVNTLDLVISFDDGASTYFTYDEGCTSEAPEAAVGDRITVQAHTQVSLLTADIIGPIIKQVFGPFNVDYISSRTIMPSDGVETGPTSTPLPTRPPFTDTPTATSSATPTSTPTPPAPPDNFVASVDPTCRPDHVDFSWDNISGINLYRIYRADTGQFVADSTGSPCNNCDNMGTSLNRPYYVVAVNAGGESAQSNISRAVCGTGATDTPTPTRTPTLTPTSTHTPTRTNTPTPTATMRPTRTPTRTATPCAILICTPTPTPNGPTGTPTAPLPALLMDFDPGYPARKATGANKQFWVKVRVIDEQGNGVTDAAVTFVDPATYAGIQLAHLGNGVYGGANGACFSGAANSNTYIRVRAEKAGYTPAIVDGYTDDNPYASVCP